MMMLKHNIKWIVIALLFIAAIPVIIMTYEVLFTDQPSVVLFENYSPKVLVIVTCYYIFLFCMGIAWFIRQIILLNKLKKERINAELLLLKAQVSPHFFFNTLNNLYGLVGKDTSKAQELILKLADMMRYSIYEGEKEFVTLQEELDFLNNYIELHQLRYHKSITIDFDCDVDGSRKITPLLFIILLENAFKHGIEKLREDAYIKMTLKTQQDQLYFFIENNYLQLPSESGIGLKNLKKRLELIYPNDHELTFLITKSVYQVHLNFRLL